MQEFVQHGNSDIRVFIVGDQVLASMRRLATGWKTNFSQGAKPIPAKISKEFEEIAIKASKAVGCKIAGVDILEGPDGPRIVDVNSQPGWKGLQVVSKVNIADEIVKFVLSEIKK